MSRFCVNITLNKIISLETFVESLDIFTQSLDIFTQNVEAITQSPETFKRFPVLDFEVIIVLTIYFHTSYIKADRCLIHPSALIIFYLAIVNCNTPSKP